MITPEVTFIIPAYNAAPYLGVAVESILSQTYRNWELIIVDDCSKDATLEIASSYASRDERIRVVQTERQSGGAYIPRKIGIMNARSAIIAPLDADDKIEPQYLKNLLNLMHGDSEIDIVYPIMYQWDGKALGAAYKHDDSLYGKIIIGRDMVKYTLDRWMIHCNGGLIKKATYFKAFENINEAKIEVKSYIDEYLSRLLLFHARKVTISSEKYYYLSNPTSITHSKDFRAFGLLWNNLQLLPFIKENYSYSSEERKLAELQNFHCYFETIRHLRDASLSSGEKIKVREAHQKSRKNADYSIIKQSAGLKLRLLFRLPYKLGVYTYSRFITYLDSKRKK